MDFSSLLTITEAGLYSPAADVYIDPWRPVNRAVITHAHADHLCWGSKHYLISQEGLRVTRARLPDGASIQTLAYGEKIARNGVNISLHPAGHILGSSQVRLEYGGMTAVISGDYKVEPDTTCTPFELVPCHLFVTESTFGLPIYRWRPQAEVFAEINDWWRRNRDQGKASMLYGYALGKAQRLIGGLDATIGKIYTHGAVERMVRLYRESGISLPETTYVGAESRQDWAGTMIIAPPSAQDSAWLRRFGELSTAFASGWMQIRGVRRQRSVDRGFALSDHVDWPNLLKVVSDTGAEEVWVTHGYTAIVARWFQEHGLSSRMISTRFEGERDESSDNEGEA